MKEYPEKIFSLMLNGKFIGTLDNANASGKSACFECGTSIRIDIDIDDTQKAIKNCGFTTSGCGYAVAAAEIILSNIKGTKLTDLGGDTHKRFETQIKQELADNSFDRSHCREMALTAFQNALVNYRRQAVLSNELVCSCYGVSETAINDAINDGQMMTVDEVGDAIRAGTGCGSCRFVIQEMIDNVTEHF